MDELEGVPGALEGRRCHLWCWAAGQTPEWERRTLVVGGFSFLGMVVAAGTAAVSASGTRRRRAAAIAAAAPRWRFVCSGRGQIVNSHLVVTEPSGIVRHFDLGAALSLDVPGAGWLRFQPSDSTIPMAVQVI